MVDNEMGKHFISSQRDAWLQRVLGQVASQLDPDEQEQCELSQDDESAGEQRSTRGALAAGT